MGRKKVQLAWIANDATRNSTLRRRQQSLMKKARELATLCDVKVCVIIFDPEQQQPNVWPSVPEAADTLAFLKSMSKTDQNKNMMDQEGIVRQILSKQLEQVRRQERDNGELETELLLHQCLAGRSLEDASTEEVSRLTWLLDTKLKLVTDRLERGGVAHGGAFALLDAATSSTDASLTLPLAKSEAQGVHYWSNLKPEKTLTEELQRQDWLNMLPTYTETPPPQTMELPLTKSEAECAYYWSNLKPEKTLTEEIQRQNWLNMLPTYAETPPPATMELQSLLILQSPSEATEMLQMHNWAMMDTREKCPSVESAMQAPQRQTWNGGAAMDVPCQSMAFDGGEGAIATTGYSEHNSYHLYDPFFSMS